MAQSFYTPYTIQTGQVPSSQSSFPALVVASDARFKTIGNGGHVQTGTDIRPYSNSSLATPLTYEMEFYDGTNGIWVGWVNVTAADGLVIYLGYGDAALSSDGSSSSTWPSQYKCVLHLPNGSSLTTNDSTSNGRNGTNTGFTAATGLADGGAHTASSSDKIELGTGAIPTTGSYSLWFKPTWASTDSVIHSIGLGLTSGGGSYIQGYKYSDNNLYLGWINGGSDGRVTVNSGSYTINQNAWNKLDLTWDSAAPATKAYLNGSQTGSTNTTNGTWNTAGVQSYLFQDPSVTNSIATADVDEFQLTNTVKTANWITTEYNNQSAPNTFWSKGGEVTVGGVVFYNYELAIPAQVLRRTQVVIL